MATKNSKRLVIDANITQSAGSETSLNPQGLACRSFLEDVLHICHRAVVNKKLEKEWSEHTSPFAKRWRSDMDRRGKILRDKDINPDGKNLEELLTRIKETAPEDVFPLLEKDFHLIEAALLTDQRIVSNDTTAYKHYNEVAKKIPELRKLIWVNPVIVNEEVAKWLQDGAKLDRERKLGKEKKD